MFARLVAVVKKQTVGVLRGITTRTWTYIMYLEYICEWTCRSLTGGICQTGHRREGAVGVERSPWIGKMAGDPDTGRRPKLSD